MFMAARRCYNNEGTDSAEMITDNGAGGMQHKQLVIAMRRYAHCSGVCVCMFQEVFHINFVSCTADSSVVTMITERSLL